jgi:23S rRNA (uracil1939-C5)-methyltransferase
VTEPQRAPVRLRAESLVHGGAVLARHDGQVVFLRGAAPGDLVEAALEPGGKGFLRGRVSTVLERGASRVDPPCPIVERCGGCPLQQISYPAQLAEKQRLVRDALERLGGVAPDAYELLPITPSPSQLRYRRRARLHRGPDGSFGFAGHPSGDEGLPGGPGASPGATSSGSASAGAGAIIPVDTCLLFEPGLHELWNRLRAAIAELGGLPDVQDLGLETSGNRGVLDLRTLENPQKRVRHKLEQLVRRVADVRGATLGPEGQKALVGEPVLADPETRLREGHATFRLRVRADLFAQANRGALPILQGAALDALGPAAQGRVLELFCGAGTLTLPVLAAGAREVVGIESAAASLDLLRRSAEEARLGQRLKLLAGDAAQLAASLRATERGRFDAVLLDPPRTGAPAAVRAAAELQAPRIVYVSCDAPTLGRDTKSLAQAGYRLVRAHPIDLFPQTAHFEVVAEFTRAG